MCFIGQDFVSILFDCGTLLLEFTPTRPALTASVKLAYAFYNPSNLTSFSVLKMFCHFPRFSDKPGKPGAPDIKESGKSFVTLIWSPPENDGGSEIFNYVVEYRPEGAFKWKRATEDTVAATTYTIKGLQAETQYDFRVSAENKAGVGPPSEGSLSIKPEDKICK